MKNTIKNAQPEIHLKDLGDDSLNVDEIELFLTEHLADMKATSPPESKHVLDLDALRSSEITFWVVKSNEKVVGCCALKDLSASHGETYVHGEIKSMRTDVTVRGMGLGSMMLEHIIDEAKARGYQRLSLETGSMDFFKPAQNLYIKHGFEFCPPFADYKTDPNSVFMTLTL